MNVTTKTDIAGIQSGIVAIGENRALYEETNFNSRADAIDFIDFHIIDRIEGLSQETALKGELDCTKAAGEKMKAKSELKKIDSNLFKRIREKISTGTPSTFREMIRKYLDDDINDSSWQDEMGYDNFDVFINGLLSDQSVPEATRKREPEMVFYQKTPCKNSIRAGNAGGIKTG